MTCAWREEIRAYILERKGLDSIPDDALLLDSSILDSFDILDLISFLESRFGVRLGEEDLRPENFRTLVEIEELLVRRSGGAV